MKKIIAAILAVMMMVSILPLSAIAADVDIAQTALTDVTANYSDVVGLNVINDDQSTLAPGVKLNEVVAYDKNGDRVEMYVTTVDTTVDTVEVYANYKDNQNQEYGLQTLSEQVAAMEANYEEPFTVVAGINASYYNTTTGKPTGAFVMEGVDVTTESEGNNYAFFAVLKDGTYMIGNKGEYSSYKGQIKEAIGGYVHIVKDGAVVSGLDKTTKYPRQTIGLTADGKVILMTADGSQTQTVGLTYQEQAEVMLAMGCVDALHLDGGNSATFGGVREGTTEFVLINSPSGLAERAVSNTLCIVSTAVADGTFDHATISGDYDYFVPNSTYTFEAKGIDASGGPADEIPADVTWALSDDSFGTITDGKFVSNGTLGDVAIQMVQGDKVVGSKEIHIVNPTSVSFDAEEKTIPYSKSASLVVQAMYNLNEIYSVPADYDIAIANTAAGSMEGFTFTATEDETIDSTTVTATYKYATGIADTVTIKFGKGSEVLFDFEDGDISDWRGVDTIYEWIDEKNAENPDATYPVIEPLDQYSNGIGKQTSNVFLASEENGGKVKNGEYSLGFTMDHMNVTDIGGWLYNYLYYTGETKVLRDVANGENGIRIGMWVYSPDVTNVAFRLVRGTETADGVKGIKYSYMKSGYDGVNTSYATNYAIPESGWIYVYYDITDVADSIKQTTSLYDPDNNNGVKATANYYPAFLQLFTGSATDTPRTMTFYIDDITIDYSDVTDDRDAPTITDTKVSASVDNFVAINGQTVNNNCLSFEATVAEVDKNNATGLDYSTAKIYVDGMDLSDNSAFKCAGNTISLTDVYLNNGVHQISFEIADKQGNVTKVSKTLTVAGTATNAVVSIAGRNESGATPKAGSIYYVDINATDAAQVKSLTTTIKLDLTNEFEYQNIICAEDVKAEYKYDELDKELTVTLTNNSALTGEQTLASIPVRVWAWDEEVTGVTSESQFATGAIPVINIELKSVYGSVVYADGTFDNDYICGFYGSMNVATELDNSTAWHKHSATALDDKAATCTESGYTGRTYCDECASVVDWGETVPATGHTYELGADGIYDCADCDKKFTGVGTDGIEYANGVAVVGWVGDSYYVDGKKLTGVCEVDGYYYDFGDNGVCDGKVKFTGLFKDGDVYRYSKVGVLASGWEYIDGDYYYFDADGAGHNGELEFIAGVTYTLTNGKLDSGVWVDTLYGPRYYYGPSYHSKAWKTIDGKDYFFENGYALTGGWQLTQDISFNRDWYYFNEDGSCDKTVRPEDGFYTDRNGLGYSKDGSALSDLQLIDGKYYYFDYKGYAKNNGTYSGILFKDDYAAYTGLETKNGVTYLYVNGRTASYGLYNVDGEYYCSNWGGVLITDGTYYVEKSYCDLPANANYTLDAEGKLVDGIVEKDGVYTYYLNGKLAPAGLYEIDGDYYFVKGSGICTTNALQYVWTTYCDLPANTNYTFGADGKMLNGVVEKNGNMYLYINGKTASCGLYELNGEYYYSYWGGVLKTDGRYYIDKTYCDLPANANYTFGADGKMLNGVVDVDGTLYLYLNGTTATCGLYELNGDYYYSYWGGVLKTDGRYYIDRTFCDLPAKANYTFGADGKMLNGVVDVDGTLYLYQNGTTATYGLFQVGDDYYYSFWGGVIKTDGRYYIDRTFCDLPVGNYEIDAEGKVKNGVVYENGGYYLYINGATATEGLYQVGDDYYYSYYGGVIRTDGTYYVSRTFCDLPGGANYTFGVDGKMLDGFVTVGDTLYYYVDGALAPRGLMYLDGYYYYVTWGGKVVTDQTCYVEKTNGYTIPMNYTFDSLGRAVL